MGEMVASVKLENATDRENAREGFRDRSTIRRTTVEGVDTGLAERKAERKRWTNEVPACNILVMSWSQIQMETARLAAGVPEQTDVGFSGGEAS